MLNQNNKLTRRSAIIAAVTSVGIDAQSPGGVIIKKVIIPTPPLLKIHIESESMKAEDVFLVIEALGRKVSLSVGEVMDALLIEPLTHSDIIFIKEDK